jgi:acetyl-CoA acetyltransferase
MHEFGTTREQLGMVALTMREHAQLNPAAQMYGRPLTMEQYLAAPTIADPYLLFDCCLESDGACAIILTTAERAKDMRHPVVEVKAVAEGHADSPDDIVNRRDFFSIGLTRAAPIAFGNARITPEAVDVALVYDCFTFEVIQQLEEAGFCDRGTGGDFVERGNIRLGGTLPVNPHGGMLSAGHLAGIGHIAEAVHQLRGTAGPRQVVDARVAAVTGWGDLGDGALAILERVSG